MIPRRAQQIIDVAFWRSFRLFQTSTGTSMDYYTPLPQAEDVVQGIHARMDRQAS